MGHTFDISLRRGLLESSSTISTSSSLLKPLQAQVDDCVSHFTEQALDLKSIGAMMVGGMTYRLGRIGAMAAGTGRLASFGIGLGVEVTAFEMTNRSLSSLTGENHLNPNLWKWGGVGGIRQGLLSSLITFGSLKGAGHLAQGENVVVQHLLQDTGMVLGHQVSGAFGVTEHPTGSLAEQFLHAEAMNLQMSAGMALASRLAPLTALEKGVDLSLRSTETPSLLPWKAGEGIHRAWAMAGAGSSSRLFGQEGKSESFYTMKSLHTAERERGGGTSAEENIPAIFTEGNPYFINKRVQDGIPIIQVEPVATDASVNTLIETLKDHLKKRRTSLLIHYKGGMLDSRKQEDLKRQIKDMFDGRRMIPENFMVAIAIPNAMPKMALIFEKKGEGMVHSWAQIRKPDSSSLALSAAKTASIPEDVPTVADAEGIKGILKDVLQADNPRLCFTGTSWRMTDAIHLAKQLETLGLDRRKSFALLLKDQSVQMVFRWEREQGEDKIQWSTQLIGHGSTGSGTLPRVPAFSEPITSRPRFSDRPLPPPQPKPASLHPSPEPSAPTLRKAEPRRSSETLKSLAETQAIIDRLKAPAPSPEIPEPRAPEPIKIPCDEPKHILDKLHPLLEYQRWKPFILELKKGSLDEDFLPTLAQFFNDHPFREGQDVSIVWEGSNHLKIWKENGQMKAELRRKMDDGISTQKFALLPNEVQSLGYQYSSSKGGLGS
jgi:hypothetical protein